MTRLNRALLLVLALFLTAAGCGLSAPGGSDEEPKVTILGPWTDDQERHFKEVLDGFGIPYTYQGTAATREVLLAEVQAGNPPDIAILPGVGELVEYAEENRLQPLTGLYERDEYGNPWRPGAQGIADDLWVPLKADLKSIVWYRESEPPEPAPAPLSAWCIGMGDDGASGWPGSDWIEDLILQRAGPNLYERWATGDLAWTDERVSSAWTTWPGCSPRTGAPPATRSSPITGAGSAGTGCSSAAAATWSTRAPSPAPSTGTARRRPVSWTRRRCCPAARTGCRPTRWRPTSPRCSAAAAGPVT